MKRHLVTLLSAGIILFALLALWFGLIRVLHIQPYMLPSPLQVLCGGAATSAFAATVSRDHCGRGGGRSGGKHHRRGAGRACLCAVAVGAAHVLSLYHPASDSADRSRGATDPDVDRPGSLLCRLCCLHHLSLAHHRECHAGAHQCRSQSYRSLPDEQRHANTSSVEASSSTRTPIAVHRDTNLQWNRGDWRHYRRAIRGFFAGRRRRNRICHPVRERATGD